MVEQTFKTEPKDQEPMSQEDLSKHVETVLESIRQTLPAVENSLSVSTELKPLLTYLKDVSANEIINSNMVGIPEMFLKAVSQLGHESSKEGVTQEQSAYAFACFIYRVRVIALVCRKIDLVIDQKKPLQLALLENSGAYFTLYLTTPFSEEKTPANISQASILSAISYIWDVVFPEHTLAKQYDNTSKG